MPQGLAVARVERQSISVSVAGKSQAGAGRYRGTYK